MLSLGRFEMSWSRRELFQIGVGAAAATASSLVPAEAQSALTGKIYVQPDQVYGQIPREIFGTAAEWNNNAGGLWRPDLDDVDPAILENAQSLKPTLLRFPGGLLTDFYHWQSGIGPR